MSDQEQEQEEEQEEVALKQRSSSRKSKKEKVGVDFISLSKTFYQVELWLDRSLDAVKFVFCSFDSVSISLKGSILCFLAWLNVEVMHNNLFESNNLTKYPMSFPC